MDLVQSRVEGLPEGYEEARFRRNLAALSGRQPDLAKRLAQPLCMDRVRFGRGGRVERFWRGAWHEMAREGIARAGVELRPGGPEQDGEPGLILGVGIGETAEAALSGQPSRPWIAWDRDPFHLVLMLSRVDLAGPLAEGRLTLALGAELFAAANRAANGPLVAHPLLGAIYSRERALAQGTARGPAVLLAEGGLFVDAVGDALARRGLVPYTLDLELLSERELELDVRASGAQWLFAVNGVDGIAEFASRCGLSVALWEVDPRLDEIAPVAAAAAGSVAVFTYREAHVELWKAAGYPRVAYRPLATDAIARTPQTLTPAQLARYGSKVAFVGNSMVAEAQRNQTRFLDLCAAVRGEASRGAELERLDILLDRQRRQPGRYWLGDWAERVYGDVLDLVRAQDPQLDPVRLLEDVAAADKRLLLAGALGPRGLAVWGDPGWALLEEFGVDYRGPAGHREELNRIYSSGALHVDLNRIYQPDIVTMRVFDVLACGGFCLTEHNAALERCFVVGEEVASYRDPEDLMAKVDHYLAHPEDMRTIAARGLAAVRERHRVDQRVGEMLAALSAVGQAA